MKSTIFTENALNVEMCVKAYISAFKITLILVAGLTNPTITRTCAPYITASQ